MNPAGRSQPSPHFSGAIPDDAMPDVLVQLELRKASALLSLESQFLRPPNPGRLNDLGAAYWLAGSREEALHMFRLCLELEPGFPAAVWNLSMLQLSLGLPYGACRSLREGLRMVPEESRWQSQLSQLEAAYPAHPVSVYTPGFASEDTIAKCIRSIQAQSYPVHEILVVDDRSPDKSTAIALALGAKVVYHPENQGLAASCNTALKICEGDFLVKVDTDIELDPFWLERVMAHFEEPSVGGVGGYLVELRTATIPDRWRQQYMAQHWGPSDRSDPFALFGADCAFRVQALKQVGGWNPEFRTNFEDFDLSRRLKEAGWGLVYESEAWAFHLRADSLPGVMRNSWAWHHPIKQLQGAYDDVSRAALCLVHNAQRALSLIADSLAQGFLELFYPDFLVFYFWSLRDLERVGTLHPEYRAEAHDTALALLFAAHSLMMNQASLPSSVTERVSQELADQAARFLEPSLRLELPSAFMGKVPRVHPDKPLSLLPTLLSRFPNASESYLQAFLEQRFLAGLDSGVQGLVGASLNALEAEESHGPAYGIERPGWVLLNPPVSEDTSGQHQGGACFRWRQPRSLMALAERGRKAGARVLLLDAVERNLTYRDTLAMVRGFSPTLVIYSDTGAPPHSAAAFARRLQSLEPEISQLLVDSENALPERGVFEAVFASLEDCEQTLNRSS